MTAIEIYKGEFVNGLSEGVCEVLMRLTPVPTPKPLDTHRPSSAMMSALTAVSLGSPQIQEVIRQAAEAGHGLTVAFPPEIARQLQAQTLHLVQGSKGVLPVAADASGHFVAHATVVGGTAVGTAGAAIGGVSAATLAVAALPVVIAGAAAYAGQRQLTKSLDEIKSMVQRIEARLEDTDTGVCDAAERFLSVAQDALADGGLTQYLRMELAAQRTAVEALYSARKKWVERFKSKLELEQVRLEAESGRGQPWVDTASKVAESGELERELLLFLRALMSRTKLGVLAASVLAEEGRGATAMKLITDMERELRSQFFDLHNRLRPLAAIEPDIPLRERLPGIKNTTQDAFETVKALVAHVNSSVLPAIPDPDGNSEIRAALDRATVAALAYEIGKELAERRGSVTMAVEASATTGGEQWLRP